MDSDTSRFESIIAQVRQELIKNADEKTRQGSLHFFKEEIITYGVKANVVHQISKELYRNIATESKSEVLDICETFWKSGYFEESIVACNWSYYLHKKFEAADFEVFQKWINLYVSNWASCDTLCNHTVGEFIEMFPAFLSSLKDFTRSDNRWVRRAAAVSLIIPARKGKFLGDIFEIADGLLVDQDDLVQKGYGWMLKAASQAHPQEVFEYVVRNKVTMPRTALRYAIEKLPNDMRAMAMKK